MSPDLLTTLTPNLPTADRPRRARDVDPRHVARAVVPFDVADELGEAEMVALALVERLADRQGLASRRAVMQAARHHAFNLDFPVLLERLAAARIIETRLFAGRGECIRLIDFRLEPDPAAPAPADITNFSEVEKQLSRVAHNHEVPGASPGFAIPAADRQREEALA